ncbi:hypothetical protein DASC09_051310 [Saccharomycopsis crataegensis]|uniref:SHSP domain-containing protein n=1 Tax=Saccharomycopsis crataegensis TaxID=43959 RepID=A0AAV5QTE4_9ASCO|nr:hypothetical protein DASC09_051310 [Saccharomycopsis crataegensis]
MSILFDTPAFYRAPAALSGSCDLNPFIGNYRDLSDILTPELFAAVPNNSKDAAIPPFCPSKSEAVKRHISKTADNVKRSKTESPRKNQSRSKREGHDEKKDRIKPSSSVIVPPINVRETRDSIEILVSIPGTTREQINVDFNKTASLLSVTGTLPRPDSLDSVLKGHLNEIETGSFERKIQIPKEVKVDHSKLTADYDNGILKVELPKKINIPKQVELPKKIEEPVQQSQMPAVRRIRVEFL